MNLDVLVATMNQKDYSLVENMRIDTDAIICNQNTEKTGYHKYIYNSNTIRWYDFEEKGVGLNRNNALLRSNADICLLADDDVEFVDGYEEIILNAFKNNPKADVIIFNIYTSENEKRYVIKKKFRVNKLNCGRFGAVRIAFRRTKIIKNVITFNQLFGGGAMFTAGEDTMFIEDCLRKGLRVIAVPDYILTLKDIRESTWFTGYNDKFFEDMGSSYYCHFGNMAFIMAFIQLFRRKNVWLKERGFFDAFNKVKKGIKKYKNL